MLTSYCARGLPATANAEATVPSWVRGHLSDMDVEPKGLDARDRSRIGRCRVR
jgi:hypothetical protein